MFIIFFELFKFFVIFLCVKDILVLFKLYKKLSNLFLRGISKIFCNDNKDLENFFFVKLCKNFFIILYLFLKRFSIEYGIRSILLFFLIIKVIFKIVDIVLLVKFLKNFIFILFK